LGVETEAPLAASFLPLNCPVDSYATSSTTLPHWQVLYMSDLAKAAFMRRRLVNESEDLQRDKRINRQTPALRDRR